jgi:predicted nucleotidyltransferase
MSAIHDLTSRHKNEELGVIQNKLHEKLPDLCLRYGIKSLGIFGSYLHGTQTRRSDLDLLVEFYEDAPVTLIGFVALEREIATHLGLRVDLVERGTLKPTIGKRILAEVVPV